MATLLCQRYPSEHYLTLFNPDTGLFVRAEEPGYEEPFWSAHGPEMLDISITSWCGHGCTTCYRDAGRRGTHMSLADYERVIAQAAALGATQVALGGGNPNQHPRFAEMLRLTRTDYGIVPNYTTNGRALTPPILRASAKYCGAVGVSAYQPYSLLSRAVEKLANHGARVHIHFVLDALSVPIALSWLREPPEFMRSVRAIVFLNYKPVGRGASFERLLNRSNQWRQLVETATSSASGFRVGFDSCMVSALATAGSASPVSFDACEAGRFSMFVSEGLLMYPCSFMEGACRGVSLIEHSMLEAWRMAQSFQWIRRALRGSECNGCTKQAVCRGGCPVFRSVNLCEGPRAADAVGARDGER